MALVALSLLVALLASSLSLAIYSLSLSLCACRPFFSILALLSSSFMCSSMPSDDSSSGGSPASTLGNNLPAVNLEVACLAEMNSREKFRREKGGGDPNWWAPFGQKSQFSQAFL